LLTYLKTQLSRLRGFLWRRQQLGLSRTRLLLWDLPVSVSARFYKKYATWLNGHLLGPTANRWRLRRFQRDAQRSEGNRFYIIVMPGTLHLLLPALALLPGHLEVVLVFNGAARWEAALLRCRYPGCAYLRLLILPGSSLAHGDVLTLLLRSEKRNFGVLDHDLYVFDPLLFDQLEPGDNQCLLALYGDTGPSGLPYPHTCFLYFNTPLMRALMQRYRVGARLYRRAPRRLQHRLDAIGLPRGSYLKGHHNFFDTLNLLLALAYSEGLGLGFLASPDTRDVFHIGGTSGGSPRTADVFQLYARQRFLELSDEPELRKRYAWTLPDLPPPGALRAALRHDTGTQHALAVIDELIPRLQRTLAGAGQ